MGIAAPEPDDSLLPGGTPPVSSNPAGLGTPEAADLSDAADIAVPAVSDATPATTEAAEAREFDFGPFRKKAMKLYEARGLIFVQSPNDYQRPGESDVAALDRLYNELVTLTAQALIDSEGKIVISMGQGNKHLDRGVFTELGRVENEVWKKRIAVKDESQSASFSQAVAAEAVKILLAERAKPSADEPGESAEPIDDGTTGAISEDVVAQVKDLEAKAGAAA